MTVGQLVQGEGLGLVATLWELQGEGDVCRCCLVAATCQLRINQSTAAASESSGVTEEVLEESRPSALLPSRQLGCSCSPARLSARVLQSCAQTQPLATCAGLWREQAAGWGSGLGGLQLLHRVLGLGCRLAPEKGEILALIPLSPAVSSSEICDYLTCHSLL